MSMGIERMGWFVAAFLLLSIAVVQAGERLPGTGRGVSGIVDGLPWRFSVKRQDPKNSGKPQPIQTERYRFRSRKPIKKTKSGGLYLSAELTSHQFSKASQANRYLQKLAGSAHPDMGLSYAWDYLVQSRTRLHHIHAGCTIAEPHFQKMVDNLTEMLRSAGQQTGASLNCRCGGGCKAAGTESVSQDLATLGKLASYPAPAIGFSFTFPLSDFLPYQQSPSRQPDRAELEKSAARLSGDDVDGMERIAAGWYSLGEKGLAKEWRQKALTVLDKRQSPAQTGLEDGLVYGRLLMALGRYAEAAGMFSNLASRFPDSVKARYEHYQALFASGRQQAASAQVTELLADYPDHLAPYVAYAGIAFIAALGRSDGRSLLERVDLAPLVAGRKRFPHLQRSLDVLEGYLISAAILMQEIFGRDNPTALWRGLVADHPLNGRIAGLRKKANQWADQAAAPEAVWAVLANLDIIEARAEDLVKTTRKLVDHSASTAAYERALVALVLMERNQPAIDLAESEISRFPAAAYRQLLGYLYDRLGNAEAADRFSSALPDKDANRDAAMAIVALRQGDVPAAGKALDSAAEKHFQGVEAAYYRGIQSYLSGDKQAALRLWSELAKKKPAMAEKTGRLLKALVFTDQ